MSNGKANGKGFVSSGIVVGQTPQSKADQRSDYLKGNKVTMGKNVPRQAEGTAGDITVREVSGIGLRCYIKTNSGWYDINALVSTNETKWTDINFTANTVSSTHFSWTTNYNASEQCQYFKDGNGIVHFRGAILCLKISNRAPTPSGAWEIDQSHAGVLQTSSDGVGEGVICDIATDGSGNPTFTLKDIGKNHVPGNDITFTDPGSTSNTAAIELLAHTSDTHVITTLPPGYRPYDFVYLPVAVGTAGTSGALSVKSDGELKGAGSSLSATLTFLDGASFVARQTIDSPAQGGTRSTRGSSTGRGTTT